MFSSDSFHFSTLIVEMIESNYLESSLPEDEFHADCGSSCVSGFSEAVSASRVSSSSRFLCACENTRVGVLESRNYFLGSQVSRVELELPLYLRKRHYPISAPLRASRDPHSIISSIFIMYYAASALIKAASAPLCFLAGVCVCVRVRGSFAAAMTVRSN